MKKVKQKTPLIEPAPGYLLAKPYIEDETVFKPVKEQDGLDQKSEILAVGDFIVDSEGITRESPCKVGDIVFNAYSNSEFELGFDKYRFIHFTQVHGILKIIK